VANGQIQVVPAIYGKKLKTSVLKEQLIEAATNFNSESLVVKTDTISPSIFDESTVKLAKQSEEIVSRSISLTFDGKSSYSPSPRRD
jgi:hypothetical protein